MSSVRNSLFLSFVQNYSVMFIQFVTTIIVARLLTPSDFGVFSVAMVLVGVAHTVRDFGVGSYVIQEKELTNDRIRSALGIAILIAWTLGGAIALLSVPAAQFYREPGVRNVMLVLAVNFLLIPFGSVTMAYLQRKMEYGPLAVVRVVTAVINNLTVVVLALLGFGFMSMAWASLAGAVTTIALAQIYRPAHFPFLPGFKQVRRVVSFGTMSTSVMVIHDATKSVPELIIGRVINMEAVAVFGRAGTLIEIFDRAVMSAVWNVAMSYFSLRHREGSDLKSQFLKSASYLTALAWPFFVVLALLVYPTVRILFGSQWDASVPLVKYLCLAGAIVAPFSLFGSILTALGRLRETLHAIMWVALAQIIAVLVAVTYGIEAVAAAFVAVAVLRSILGYVILKQILGFTLRELIGALTGSAGVTVFASVLPAAVVAMVPADPQWLWTPAVLGGAGALAGWTIGIFVLRHPFREEIAAAITKFRRRRNGG